MSLDKNRYPSNWNEISRQIRAKAGDKCENCGVSNHQLGYRDDNGIFIPVDDPDSAAGYPILVDDGVEVKSYKVFRIILTVAHIGAPKIIDGIEIPGDPHDKMDVRPENLRALCSQCHFRQDIEEHKVTRKRNILIRKALLNDSW